MRLKINVFGFQLIMMLSARLTSGRVIDDVFCEKFNIVEYRSLFFNKGSNSWLCNSQYSWQ
jgi:hypothetical protein